MRRKRQKRRRKNLYIRKAKPKFVVSLTAGGEIWNYDGFEIELKPDRRHDRKGKWIWQLYQGTVPIDVELVASDRHDALSAAKAEIDRIRYSGELSMRTTMATWQSFDVMNSIIEQVAFRLGHEGKPVTRAAVSRILEQRRGGRYNYDFTFFDSLPLKGRLQWIDDRIASAKRKLRLAAKPNRGRRSTRRPTRNPARGKAIMRRFMQL